jgi:hypothetical protein
MVPGRERYCSPRCAVETAETDCRPLSSAPGSHSLVGDGSARGRSELVARGLYCLPADNFGAATTERRCGFICPRGSAAVWDKDGRLRTCECLPGHEARPQAGGVLVCAVSAGAGSL